MQNLDELFSGEPIEHLVKILQNASPRAIQNTLENILGEYIALQQIAERHALLDEVNLDIIEHTDEIQTLKNDLSIRIMSEILSQE